MGTMMGTRASRCRRGSEGVFPQHARLLQDMGSETPPACRSWHLQARQFSAKIQLQIYSHRWLAVDYLNQLASALMTSSAEKQHRKKISNESNTSPTLVGRWFSSRSVPLSCVSAMVRAKF